MRLRGRAAIVTGGGRGIGRAVALALAEEGAAMVIASRTREELMRVAGEIDERGGRCIWLVADVRSERDVKRLVEEAVDGFGGVDILINNAGVGLRKPLLETTEEEWDAVIDTNLKGVYLCTRTVLPGMISRGRGVIVNISSGAGRHGFPELAAYCASKFGVVGFTQAVADEVADKGVRVYCLCPGGVDTGMYREFFQGEDYSLLLRPEEIAEEVLRLCLPGSDVPPGKCLDIF